jgi:flagellar basal-body rod protein FlgB
MRIDNSQDVLLMRLLDATGQRSRLLAHNVANQNTPGYRRQVLRFEEQLGAAIRQGNVDLAEIQPTIGVDETTPGRADGNNVIAELEKNASQENSLMAESYLALLDFHFRTLRSAIGTNR